MCLLASSSLIRPSALACSAIYPSGSDVVTKMVSVSSRRVSYWSRAVMVPLLVLCSLKPKAKNPRQVQIPELFVTPAEGKALF